MVGSVQEHHLSAGDARRIAVLAQLLGADRPTDLMDAVDHLTLLQSEPTAAVAPSAEVVAWSRLGPAYRLGGVDRALADGRLVELHQMLRPAADIALYRAEMAAWPGTGELTEWQHAIRGWVEANDDTRRDVLAKLYDDGPLPSSELPDTTLVPWESSGWNNDRNVRMLLGLMVQRGEVAVAGYEGRDKLWDLAERVYPDVEAVPLEEALRLRAEGMVRANGVVRGKVWNTIPGESLDTREMGEPARVEGVRGRWRVDPAYLDVALEPRVAVLSPLDRLIFDRKRMEELFGFDYQLEQYKPVAKRRWGYWAMPVLDGDRLVGKVDATAERDRGVLRVDAVHEDEPFDAALADGVRRELDGLADCLGLVREGPGT
jgi:uncharacterized protein YcaQ